METNFLFGMLIGIVAIIVIAGMVMGTIAFFKAIRNKKHLNQLDVDINRTNENIHIGDEDVRRLIKEVENTICNDYLDRIKNLQSQVDSRIDKLTEKLNKKN